MLVLRGLLDTMALALALVLEEHFLLVMLKLDLSKLVIGLGPLAHAARNNR